MPVPGHDSTETDRVALRFRLMDRLTNCFETTIIHHQKSAIEESEFTRYTDYMAAVTKTPGGGAWLAAGTFPLSSEAKKLLS
jgi:hypothetical protein